MGPFRLVLTETVKIGVEIMSGVGQCNKNIYNCTLPELLHVLKHYLECDPPQTLVMDYESC